MRLFTASLRARNDSEKPVVPKAFLSGKKVFEGKSKESVKAPRQIPIEKREEKIRLQEVFF